MASVTRLLTGRDERRWPLAALLVCAATVAIWFVVRDVSRYVSLDPAKFTPYYWPRRYGLITHVSAGLLALIVGMVQVWLGLTGRTYRLHRRLGRVYVAAVLLGSSAAFYLAATIPPPATLYNSGLFGLGLAWIITTAVAYRAVRRGALTRHREWMIRSYVVTFGFVMFRVIEGSLRTLALGTDDSRFSIAAWLCWTVPLLLTEVAIRGLRQPAPAVAAGA